ncbi:Gfo/Idh/MocA family oxidoreductase [Paenibacillus motobuensis]|uniref:Gfo/Idh/MocA family oxidoreductase n=1 Tax=Paenibacillus motobuensis TaxID=295324 RepID=A0ABP3IJ34_9BACL
MAKITLALVGAGERGQFSYAPYARTHEYELEFVAVADPNEGRRASFQKEYHIKDEMAFASGEQFFVQPKLADAVLICTQDNQHFDYACQAIRKGYIIMLEKPISPNLQECLELQRLAEEYGTTIVVCHVLRYTKFYRKMKELIDRRVIGDIVSVMHAENVAYWHYAHSYVRGNWHVTADSSPMILAKCCHDMDILAWLLDSKCSTVSSFGDLKYFKKENAPEGSPERCTDGCSHSGTCPYYAPDIYLTEDTSWPTSCLGSDMSYEARKRALMEGPYGKCVFHNDNDVVDHQVANLLFDNGVTVAFTMCAFTNDCDRTMKFMGTKGEIRASMEKNVIEVTEFATGTMNEYRINPGSAKHSGGDEGIMEELVAIIKGERDNTNLIQQSVHSHVMAFAVEESRLTGRTVQIADFVKRVMDAQQVSV